MRPGSATAVPSAVDDRGELDTGGGGTGARFSPVIRWGGAVSTAIGKTIGVPPPAVPNAFAWVAVGGRVKPSRVKGPAAAQPWTSATTWSAGSTLRNEGAKRAVTSAAVSVTAPPLSSSSSHVSCLARERARGVNGGLRGRARDPTGREHKERGDRQEQSAHTPRRLSCHSTILHSG